MNTPEHDPRYADYLQDDGFNFARIRILQIHEDLQADAASRGEPLRPLTPSEVEADVQQYIEDLQQAQVDGFYEGLEALDYEAELEAQEHLEEFQPRNNDGLT